MAKQFPGGTAHLEIFAGESITNAARKALDVAERINGTAFFKFNGFAMKAEAGDTAEQIAGQYDALLAYEAALHAARSAR